jgi:protein arginine N-methyltransferase 5
LRFYIPHAGVLHGLAGYFEAVLYGNVGLSIHPHRKDQISKDMLSWFPLFFPFKVRANPGRDFIDFPDTDTLESKQEPLYLPSNSELHVSIWRRTNERKVWYEWYAESFLSVGMLSPLSVLTYATKSTSPLGNGSYTFPPPTSQPAPPSPLVDAVDSPRKDSVRMGDSANGAGIVKTGQTSLHNPGGRSSWIGL